MAPTFGPRIWHCFDEVCDRARNGKEFVKELSSFFKKRAECERSAGKALVSLAKPDKGDPAELGTVLALWGSLRGESESQGKRRIELAEQLTTQCCEPLNVFLKETRDERHALESRGKKLIDELKKAESDHQHKRKAYESQRVSNDACKTQLDTAMSSGAKEKEIARLQKKLTSESKSSDDADSKYREAVKRLAEMQEKNHDTELPQILNELEALETRRIMVIKQTATAFSNLTAAETPFHQDVDKKWAVVAGNVSAEKDNAAFVAAQTDVDRVRPPKCEYEPYSSAAQRCVPAQSMRDQSGALNIGPGVGQVPLSQTPAASPAVGRANTGAAHPNAAVQQAAAASALSAASSSSSSSQSPTPTPAPQTSAALGPGVDRGADDVGVSAATAAGDVPPPAGAGAPATVLSRVRCKFDYAADDDGELSFKGGDIINVLHKDPSGWWQGELNGAVGLFPSTDWVEEIEEPMGGIPAATTVEGRGDAAAAAAAAGGAAGGAVAAADGAPPLSPGDTPMSATVRALYLYQAEEPSELSINEGDQLQVFSIDPNGWYTGKNAAGQIGRFPSNFCEEC